MKITCNLFWIGYNLYFKCWFFKFILPAKLKRYHSNALRWEPNALHRTHVNRPRRPLPYFVKTFLQHFFENSYIFSNTVSNLQVTCVYFWTLGWTARHCTPVTRIQRTNSTPRVSMTACSSCATPQVALASTPASRVSTTRELTNLDFVQNVMLNPYYIMNDLYMRQDSLVASTCLV